MTSDYHRNAILASLPPRDRHRLLRDATFVTLRSGHTLQFPGQRRTTVFFPTYGVVSGLTMLPGGQNVEIATIGTEGVVGTAAILGLPDVQLWFVVQMGASGYQVPAETFVRMFDTSESLRTSTLAHVGSLLREIVRSAACNRFHSHRQRLARWLIVTMQKAGIYSLALTHEFIAQMVGGPRHAVTAALAELRKRGAINYHRGLIVIVDERKLRAAACECVEAAHPSNS